MAKILLVSDDSIITDSVKHDMRAEEHFVDTSMTVQAAKMQLHLRAYDLIVMDSTTSDGQCITFCRQYRSGGGTARILAIANHDSSHGAAEILDAGGDDFILTPLTSSDFRAHVRALLRRRGEVDDSVIVNGDLVLEPAISRVTANHRVVDLTPKEYGILLLLMQNPSKSFSADAILDKLWSSSSASSVATVRTHVRSLRRKLIASGIGISIKSARGWGYRLDETDS